MACDCAEGFVNGRPTGVSKETGDLPHDCEYVAVRNSLLPKADCIANAAVLDPSVKVNWYTAFNEAIDGLVKSYYARPRR
jgi:hypothetical protein